MTYDSREDTRKHIEEVKGTLKVIRDELLKRGLKHDASKLVDPEKAVFDDATPKLEKLTYGSKEYKKQLKSMDKALKHHYESNRHHPEHHKNGVKDMNLVDLVEMFCDWVAATKRHADGDIYASITINKERFDLPPMLAKIFENTAKDTFGMKGKK